MLNLFHADAQRQDQSGIEKWEEPEAEDVEEEVWKQIRETGFGGKKLKNRCLRRIWSRRAKIAKEVDELELGKAGGVFSVQRRTAGKQRQACLGRGHRRAVAEVLVAGKEAGEEGGEEAGKEAGEQGGEEKKGTLKVVSRRCRASALKSIFDEIKITFEKWRMGGQSVDNDEFYKPSVPSKAKNTKGVSRP